MLLIFSEHENVGTDLFKPIFRIKAIGALVLLFDSDHIMGRLSLRATEMACSIKAAPIP